MLRNGESPTRLEAREGAAAVARFVRNPCRQMNNDNNHGDNGPQEQGQMIQQVVIRVSSLVIVPSVILPNQ